MRNKRKMSSNVSISMKEAQARDKTKQENVNDSKAISTSSE